MNRRRHSTRKDAIPFCDGYTNTKKTAEQFFGLLLRHQVKRLVDIRLNNSSQLAGFAKGADLQYFAHAIGNIDYVYIEEFAPTKELLNDYQNKQIVWEKYQTIYHNLLEERNIIEKYNVKVFDGSCFLCSEDSPEFCHRRLLVEYFKSKTKGVDIIHLR